MTILITFNMTLNQQIENTGSSFLISNPEVIAESIVQGNNQITLEEISYTANSDLISGSVNTIIII